MRKNTLTISSLLFSVVATIASTAATAKERLAFGADIEARCQQITSSLNKTAEFKESDNFYGYLSQLEALLIPANNLLFESYLYANVSTDTKIIGVAEQCQLTTSANIDKVLGSAEVTTLLSKAKGLAENDLEQRVYQKYHNLNQQLSNLEYAKLKAEGKAAAAKFRKGAVTKVKGNFELPGECAANLDKKYQKRYLKDGKVIAELKGSNYATFIKRLPDEECRKLAFSQYQGRHAKNNKDNLLQMIKLRNDGAKALGFANFAELSLQDTMIKSVKDVDTFLTNIVNAEPESLAPWDYRYIPYVKEKQSAAVKDETISPKLAHKGLFTLLESEFGLTVTPLKEAAWHNSVGVYMLKEAGKDGQNIGKFYLDLYPRKNKYKKNRHRAITRGVEGVQAPSGALILNLPKDKWKQTHLKSFFHEFGHLLHNLVAKQKYHIVAGISIENDLVEMPAKWFEWLSFDAKMQQRMFGKVVAVGDAPDSGTTFKLRLYKAGLALAYFSQNVTGDNIESINAKLALKFLGHPYAKGASNQYSFSHLGTYGPRYYSYIWSEVVARRMLEDYLAGRYTGRDYLNSLFKQGGSIEMTEMFSLLYDKSLNLQDIIKWVSHEKTL